MAKYLVIVESPTKARTIFSILGKDYDVISSMGHLVDLPATKLSVDVENEFKPAYRIIPGKEKIIKQIRSKAEGKDIIYLATDPDREGEAISWHIKENLKLKSKKIKVRRVVFHEITEEALIDAFKRVGRIDVDKVNAQIARRVLDRIVGYSLSPFLWKKIVRGLSAGRVQSVALKFIVEREKEIREFKPVTTYSLEASLVSGKDTFKARLVRHKGKKIIFKSNQAALKCIEELKKNEFIISSLTSKESLRKPPSPHITSILQQDGFSRLRFSARKTMLVAQKLYEGIKIKDKPVGLITYMRTDSFHVSAKAKTEVKGFIDEKFGRDYLSEKEYRYKKKKGAQLAHEAIRPTSVYREPAVLAESLADDEANLYDLIWRRFTAAFMKEARYKNTKAVIKAGDYEFEATGRRVLFEGYLKAYNDNIEENPLPELRQAEAVSLAGIEALTHITKPPARYNDASLVKLLEEKGIGRPSTYAPIIYTLIIRNYIKREKRAFMPSELGEKVSDLLIHSFPKIMDDSFTGSIEEELDEVERGKLKWHKVLKDFYLPFKRKVDLAISTAKKEHIFSDKFCPQCKGRLAYKWSRRGRFLSCEHFPKCRYGESISSGVSCPECKDGQLVERRNKRGQNFYGCSKFPACRYTSRNLPKTETEQEPDK